MNSVTEEEVLELQSEASLIEAVKGLTQRVLAKKVQELSSRKREYEAKVQRLDSSNASLREANALRRKKIQEKDNQLAQYYKAFKEYELVLERNRAASEEAFARARERQSAIEAELKPYIGKHRPV